MTVSSNSSEDTPRRDRWRSDEHYLVSEVCCGVGSCGCGKRLDGLAGLAAREAAATVTVTAPAGAATHGAATHMQLPADWGPVAAEAAVEEGWAREAAARDKVVGEVTIVAPEDTEHLRDVLAAALTPEPESDEPCCADEGQAEPPWGVLPSEKQMAAQRDADYGHPGPNFTTTAAMWSEYINAKYGTALRLDTDDVPAMNVLQKVARQARKSKRDNWDDISGYADTAIMAAHGG